MFSDREGQAKCPDCGERVWYYRTAMPVIDPTEFLWPIGPAYFAAHNCAGDHRLVEREKQG
jgi:hypothetical protein